MVVVEPYYHVEAVILQKLSDALNNPDEDYLQIEDGPISPAIASTIEELLLSTKHQKRWRVWLSKCYPKDEDAFSILSQAFYKAFRKGRIGDLYLDRLDSTNERGRDMLLAVFGMACATDESHHNPMGLHIFNCIFGHTMMPHMQSWARDVTIVSELVIYYDCFCWKDTPTTTECVAKMFEQAREKPNCLHFNRISRIGDIECLRDWKLKSVQIERSCQIRTLSGLSSMAPTLKNLDIFPYHVNNSLADMDMGIIALLEDPNCCLEDLSLSSKHVKNAFVFSLFKALSNVQSLKRLDIHRIVVDNPSIWHAMLEYLHSNPTSLKELLVHESMLLGIPSAANHICDVLRSENNTIERFAVAGKYFFESRELQASVLPYPVRNRAGRRILQDEQVPPSLMADVLGRTQQMKIDSFYDINVEEAEVLRTDATYHLVREGLAAVFSSRKRQRTNSLGA